MYTVLIVDDEEPAREELRYLLEQDETFQVVAEAADGEEALEKFKELEPQIVFLDIQMPGIDGFDVAKTILGASKSTVLVFATAYNQFAIKAFEHAALDYLLKPINKERLQQTLTRIKSIIGKQEESKLQLELQKFLSGIKAQRKLERIAVWERDKVILLQPEEISLLVTEGRGTNVVTSSKVYFSNDTLTELEGKLRAFDFMRTHKSYVVNLQKIKEVVPWFNNTYVLKIEGSAEEVPVSRTYLKEFKERISL